jgi:N-formylglutamate amidohydrolase
MTRSFARVTRGEGPVVVTAIHDGHDLRGEVAAVMALTDAERLREEDPFTGALTNVAGTTVVVNRSRFEVDLNRSRDKAVYRTPEDAWGLHVWEGSLAANLVSESLAEYDDFYSQVERLLVDVERRHGRFVVLDLHSYNHRRGGPGTPCADPAGNPEVNVGTGTMDREQWAFLVDRFLSDLAGFDFLGRHLDVRENVKFRGGHFSRWVHERFPASGCALAIEFKKFFMDEWTGEPDMTQLEAMRSALRGTLPGMVEALGTSG